MFPFKATRYADIALIFVFLKPKIQLLYLSFKYSVEQLIDPFGQPKPIVFRFFSQGKPTQGPFLELSVVSFLIVLVFPNLAPISMKARPKACE